MSAPIEAGTKELTMRIDIEVPFWDGDKVVYGGFKWIVAEVDEEIILFPSLTWNAGLEAGPYDEPRPSVEEVVREFVRASR